MTLQSEGMGKLVAVDPDIQGGEPCIAGTRVTVRAVQKFAAAGCSIVQIADEYPTLTFEQIDAALAFRPAHREAQPENDGGGEAVARLNALANLIERPPMDDVQLEKTVALEAVKDIRTVTAILNSSTNADLVAMSASDRACYEYPGADQHALRQAFVAGAVAYATPTPEGQTEGADREVIATAVFDCPEIRGEFDMATARKVADYILAALASKGV